MTCRWHCPASTEAHQKSFISWLFCLCEDRVSDLHCEDELLRLLFNSWDLRLVWWDCNVWPVMVRWWMMRYMVLMSKMCVSVIVCVDQSGPQEGVSLHTQAAVVGCRWMLHCFRRWRVYGGDAVCLSQTLCHKLRISLTFDAEEEPAEEICSSDSSQSAF